MTIPATQHQTMTAKQFFAQDMVKQKFAELLGKRSTSFITSVLQIVNSNGLLSKADPTSIFNAAATAATLDLPINQNLGFAYIVPYNGKAQFQLGYKGFIQLAQRSGQFHRISSTPIYEGQIKASNPLTGYEFDFDVKPEGDPIGYAAYFRLLNGFEATMYMTLDEVTAHGKRYSKSFNSGPWKTDFPAMACKTVLKLLLAKFAPLSVEMQKAIITDQAIINDVNAIDVSYPDNSAEEINKEVERMKLMIGDCTTVEEYWALKSDVEAINNEELSAIYAQKGSDF